MTQTSPSSATRTEKDTMGEMRVPATALYGASTQRAVLNFPVSGRPVPEPVIKAYAILKEACAGVNRQLGRLDEGRTGAIRTACREILSGLAAYAPPTGLPVTAIAYHFPVDIYQTGSGTSTNMNANEVIANLVCLQRGKPIGSSKDAAYLKDGGVHPNDHVNMGQSSNDTFPTAMNIAGALLIQRELIPAVQAIAADLEEKAKAWDTIVKIGRTHLADATPIRLGQEFSGYASQMRHAEARLKHALEALSELAIGGTAVGTGLNAPVGFAEGVAARIAEITGLPFTTAPNKFEALAAHDALVMTHGALNTVAASLFKIANDIRFLGSGPRSGLGELALPENEPGSSIMPGKVNPTQCEALTMVCCQVFGNQATLTFAGSQGHFELNVYNPVMAYNFLQSVQLLGDAARSFTDHCVAGIVPRTENIQAALDRSLMLVTALAPKVGYDAAAKIAKTAHRNGTTLREEAVDGGYVTDAEFDALVRPEKMIAPDPLA